MRAAAAGRTDSDAAAVAAVGLGVLDGARQVAAFAHRAARLLDETAAAIAASERGGASAADALQNSQWQGIQASIAFGEMLIVRSLVRGVAAAPPSCRASLTRVKDLYVLSLLLRRVGDFTSDRFVSAEQLDAINRQLKALMPAVRAEAVALLECFGHTDLELNSAIGPYDGKVYERLLQVRASAMSATSALGTCSGLGGRGH